MDYEYRLLFTAIIRQAVYDYNNALKIINKYKNADCKLTEYEKKKLLFAKKDKSEIEKFFLQPDFNEFYQIDGKKILEFIQSPEYKNKVIF